MKFVKQRREHFIAPLVVMAILCVIFIIKGVYPFGSRTVAYYDMPFQYVPLFTHAHDFLHGKASLFYNWYNGASCNFYCNYITYGINPFNLIFLFTSRDNIIQAMSILLTIKLMLCSETMSVYLRRTYSMKALPNIALSVAYAFSGYVYINYMNIFFLDIVILFPLFMMALKCMIDKGICKWYLLMAAILLSLNWYLAAMVLIFTVLYVFGHMVCFRRKKESDRVLAANLGIYTVLALLISIAVFFANIFKTLNSARTDYNDNSYLEIIQKRTGEFDIQKHFMLFGAEFGIAAILLMVIRTIKDKKKLSPQLKLYLYLIPVFAVPIICEASNLIWHFGSYAHFPYRFGFILSFTLLDVIGYYLHTYPKQAPVFEIKRPKLKRFSASGIYILSAIPTIVLVLTVIFVREHGIADLESFMLYHFYLASAILVGALALGFLNKKVLGGFMLAFVVLQSGISGYGFIAPDECSNVDGAVEIGKIEHIDDNLSRVKQLAPFQIPNYSMTAGIPALCDWTLDISTDYFKELPRLGYSRRYTMACDNGGTAFSDALLNIKQVISDKNLDEELYDRTGDVADCISADCKYTVPFGILVSREFVELKQEEDETPFEYQNRIYQALTGDDEPLIKIVNYGSITNAEDIEIIKNLLFPYKHKGSLDIDEKSTVYIYAAGTQPEFLININGKAAPMAPANRLNFNAYPISDSNNIVSLGTYENTTLQLDFESSTSDASILDIGLMDHEKLENFCRMFSSNAAHDVSAKGSKLSMKVSDPENSYIFLPIEYDKEWKVKINGKKAETIPVLEGAFMAIKLGSEDAEISMKFVPVKFYTGLLIGAVGLFMLAVITVMKRKKHDLARMKFFNTTALICFDIAAIAVIAIIYVIPVVGNIESFFIL
jgi:uncharacterized membrane protein YfhO